MNNKESIIRKVVKKTKVGTVRRAIKYRSITDVLNIKNGMVTNVDQIMLKDGQLISTGIDPKIFIRLNKPTKKLSVDLKVNSKHNDDIDLFYSNYGQKEASFSYNQCLKIGKTNGTKINRDIIFPTKVKYMRLDLGNHATDLNIDDFKIVPQKSIGDEFYNEYTPVLEHLNDCNNKKNIVIVTHALNETGAPLLAFNIAKSFKQKKYEVFVLSLSDGYLEEKFNEENIKLISLHQSPLSKELHNPKLFEDIVIRLKNKGYTNVLTNTIISGITAPLFKKYGFNIISLIHEMKMSIELYDMKQGGRDINLYSDKIIFPDKIVYEDFFKVFNENNKKSIICPQGLYKLKEDIVPDYEKVYKKYDIPKNSKIILGSGTADFRKGIDLFLLAAQKLISLEENEEYHFIWAGKIYNEELEEWYKLQFEKGNIKDRFHNIEFIKDKKEYQNLVTCSDAFWLTSREDPYPSVMIEAIEYNTPVVAFKNCGGANSLLADGRGILVDNFDINEMALETKKLIDSKEITTKMLTASQKFVKEKLVFNDYINSLEKFFSEISEFEKKSKKADVSVIVPNYNYEEFLPVRLKSIINQTIKPKEIIFLDDVSKDNSVEVARKILEQAKKEHGIDYKIIKNETNNGCFRQWLKGIDLAKYPYVWIAEADDYAENNFIETLIPYFKDEKVNLAYVKSNVIDENCKVIDYDYNSYIKDLAEDKWENSFVENGKEQVKKYFSRKNIIPNASSVIIRKSATEGLADVLSKFNIIGDWLAYIYIISSGKVAYSSNCLNGHRRHSKSIIAKKEKSKNFIKEILEIKQYVVDNIPMDDEDYNNLVLSIEGMDYYHDMIMQDEKLKSLFDKLINTIQSKLKKKNIMIIVPDLTVGGGQTVAIRLANSITKYYNVFLVNARFELENSIMKNMIAKNVNLLNKNDINSLKIYNKLLKLSSVISFIWWSDKLAHCAFKDENVPLIISMHGCYEMLLHNPGVDGYFNENVEEMLERANRIVYTAEKNKEVFEKFDMLSDPKIIKIDNGFVLGDFPKKSRQELGIKEDDFVFGLVARAIPEKGYEEAIKALKIVNKKNAKKAHLILVGGSEYINGLKKKYSDEHIHFIDEFSLPLEWLGWEELFDVGLLPSYFKSESLPTVIVEYLYLQKPIIATNIAEIKSMIDNEEDQAGACIPLKDGKADIDILAKEMNKMMNDSDYYKKLKKNTSKLANRFDMDKCIDNYKILIEENNQDE